MNIPTSSCLSGRFFRIGKCIPLTSGPFWRRKWQPTSVFLPVKSHGQRNLAGYSPWSPKKLDSTERLSTHLWSMSFFDLAFLNCFSGKMSLQISSLRVCFLSLKFYSFPGSIPHWFSKTSILGVVFPTESVLLIRWPKYWSFSFSISPSNEYSGLIFFRMDCLDLLAVQWTLKRLLQHNSSKA